MKGFIAMLATVALLAVSASPADAAGYLSKGQARAKTTSVVRSMYLDLDFATSYWVEPASRCSRRGYSVVQCDWELYDDTSDIACPGKTRVRRTNSNFLRITFP